MAKTIKIKLTKGLETQLRISGFIDDEGEIRYCLRDCYMNPCFVADPISHVVRQGSNLQEACDRIEMFADSRYNYSRKTKLKIEIK